MSEENVEIVRRLSSSWRDRDYSAVEELCHPDVVFDVSRNVFNPGVHRGIDGLRHFMATVDEAWESFAIIPEELIDAGDKVVMANRMSGKGVPAGRRPRCWCSPSSPSKAARSCISRAASGVGLKPSKPPDCRSRDVGGERGSNPPG